MVSSAVRRALLAEFPRGLPLLILAPAETGFERIAAETGDDAIAVRTLPATGALGDLRNTAAENIIVEGFDYVDDPTSLSRALRDALPSARLFALIANGAHTRALEAFFAGEAPARAHPLVAKEIRPLFEGSGWHILGVREIADPAIPPTVPNEIRSDHLWMTVETTERLRTLRTEAFVAICDPA